jgi:dipeptidase E
MAAHLFAIGGGGWNGPQGGPNRLLLEVLRTTGKKHPKVCLIHTASREQPETFLAFADLLNSVAAHPNYLSLYRTPTSDLAGWVMEFDAVYISGGNTRNLLALWKAWDLDRILIDALGRGLVIAGASAGANCWFEQSSSDFIAGELNPIAGLGLLAGSFCPHYITSPGRRESYLAMVGDGRLRAGYAATDRAALHYVDGALHEALVEWDEAGVYRVERAADGQVRDVKLPARVV